jgi:PAS domain S-box-containing protein
MTQFLKKGSMRKFGLGFVDEIPWGTHFCQLYETKKDLKDILVPYFAEGLRDNEFCMWVTSPPLEVEEAKAALREAVPDLDEYVRKAQIEILPYTEWYLLGGEFDIDRVLQGWVEKEKAAVDRGFEGLRLSGNTYWIGRSLWRSFTDYEAAVNDVITSHRMLALCTYSLEKCTGMDVVDVLKNHVGALIIEDKEWHLVEDITRRRKTEELYLNVIQTSIDSFWIIDAEGHFLDVNAAYCKLVGYSRGELLKMRVQDVEVKESSKEVLQHVQKIKRRGRDRFEARHRRKNGQVVDIEVVAKYMGDDDGRIFAFAHDITRRKRNEEAIRQSEVRYRELADSVTDPFFAMDSNLRYTYWNEASETLTGIKAEDAIGKRVFDVAGDNKATRRAVKAYKKVIRTKKPQLFVNEYLIGDRNVFFEIRAYPTKDGISVFSREITDRKKAEEALKNSEERYRSLFNSMTEGFILLETVCDDTGKIVDFRFLEANPAFEATSNLKRKEITGKTLREVLPDADYLFETYDSLMQSKEPTQLQLYYDATDKWYDIYAYNPKEDQIAALLRDITQTKRAEQALHQAKIDWERTFHSVPDLIAILNNQHRIVRVNRAMADQLGMNPEQCIGLKCYEYVHGTNSPPDFCPHVKTLQDQKEHVAEVHEDRLGGDFVVSTTPLTDEKGQMIGSVHVARNITERKKVEQALRESQLDLNRAQTVAKTGSWRLDAQRNELRWSDETYRMFGVTKGTPLTYETFIGCVHPKDREYVDMKWQAALRGEPYDIEHRITVNGEVKWVREKAELEFAENGTPRGGFGTVQEITKIVEMREELEHYSKHLEDLVEEKTRQLKNAERLAAIGETAGMIGHDIRNPLQAIIGELYLSKDCLHSLSENAAKQELADSLRVIEEQTFYIDKIVTDLQDYAKPLAPHIAEADLESIVDSVLSTMDIPDNIQVAYSIEEGYPKLVTDSSYMKRILTNLVTNAVQAMPDGGAITINAYYKDHQAFITVEDSGEGIPEEAKTKIFKPLFTTKAKGQGFGLAVAKKLTDALDGTITYESEKGKGTKFIIQFPQNPRGNNT